MRVKDLDTPKSTGTVWDNELFRMSEYKEGTGWSEIMDNVHVGDKVINGTGTEFLVIMIIENQFDDKWTNDKNVGLNWLTVLHPTKLDGTVHRGLASIEYHNIGFGWERR